MADSVPYPQIPSTIWWGVRNLLIQRPTIQLDSVAISSRFGVQPRAAQQYLRELQNAGILDEEGRASDLAKKWRLDDSYREAVEEIAANIYPQQLLDLAPPGEADRNIVKNWFMTSAGLGEGSANNKTATYFRITANDPGDSATENGQPSKTSASRDSSNATRTRARNDNGKGEKVRRDSGTGDLQMPLNVNVQIHISADASADQIDTIFSSMAKHLRNQ